MPSFNGVRMADRNRCFLTLGCGVEGQQRVVKDNLAWHPKPDTRQCLLVQTGQRPWPQVVTPGSTAVISVEVRRCLPTSTEQRGAPR